MTQDRPARLLAIARKIASSTPDFHAVRGPGDGDRATHDFMKTLRQRAAKAFGKDVSERRVCGATSYAVDFYFPEERTIVEVALGLPNPTSEFEKDILKALVARDHGNVVHRLWFISRPGAARKCAQPGRAAVIRWADVHHALRVDVNELLGQPRPPRRRLRERTNRAESER